MCSATLKTIFDECLIIKELNTSFNSCSKLLLGLLQGSILGPLLFKIYVQFFLTNGDDWCV